MEHWLIDKIEGQRTLKGRAQSRVIWRGYKNVPQWYDDDKLELSGPLMTDKYVIVPPDAPTPAPEQAARKQPQARKRPAPAASKATTNKHPQSGIAGLSELMSGIDSVIYAAARDWCKQEGVSDVSLVVEAAAEEDLISALPINSQGVAAKLLRQRMAAQK